MTEPAANDAVEDTTTAELVPFRPADQIIDRRDLRSEVTDSWTDVLESVAVLSTKIAQTDFVPDEYRGKPGQIAATILYGRELGLPPMTALATTHPIHGKPSTSAEGMRALVLQAGHAIEFVESTNSRCVMRGRRRDEEEWQTVTWTLDDVRTAKIRNPNYGTYPRQMLQARATAELCRLKFADVIHGLRAAEELVDDIETVAAAPAPVEDAPTGTVQRKRGRPRKTAAEKKPEASKETPAPAEEEKPAPPPRKRAPIRDRQPVQEDNADPAIEDQQREIREMADERRRLITEQADGGNVRPQDHGNPTPKLTAGQRASIMMHFARLDMAADRDERLWWTNRLLDLDPGTIGSANELNQRQAGDLLEHLEKIKDRDQLDGLLDEPTQPTLDAATES